MSCVKYILPFVYSGPTTKPRPAPPNAGRYRVASLLCLVGYVKWDARSDRVPPQWHPVSTSV
jgi:hypothetical protein